MSELDTIKLFFKFLFEKYNHLELGIRYEYDALSNDHMIEISNEDLFQIDDFRLESFEFAMSFIEKYSEFVLFLKPSDPVHINRVDYSESNFYKYGNYVSSQKNEVAPLSIENLKEKYTNAMPTYYRAA
jgi:hypothetical protein